MEQNIDLNLKMNIISDTNITQRPVDDKKIIIIELALFLLLITFIPTLIF